MLSGCRSESAGSVVAAKMLNSLMIACRESSQVFGGWRYPAPLTGFGRW
jgi:hypothetical protein